MELDLAYDHCRRVAKREAKNFYYAFVTLPPQKRRSIYAVYAFCRLCDDVADDLAYAGERLQPLEDLRAKLSAAYSGRPDGPVLMALAHAASVYDIPEGYLQEVISGVETDLTRTRYRDFEELREYCYQVASVVGLICLQIFGYRDPRARQHAVDMGLAMQLTNILRDVKEDLERDRIYLPREDMARFGYSEEELRAGIINSAFLRLMEHQAQRARQYFDSGFRLVPLLSMRSRACPAVLGQIYSRVLDRIVESEFDVFNGRISLSTREKYLLTASTWVKSLLPLSSGPR